MPVSESFILSDPDLKDPIPLEYLSHADRYSAEVKKSCLLMAKLRQASARYNIYLSSRKKNYTCYIIPSRYVTPILSWADKIYPR